MCIYRILFINPTREERYRLMTEEGITTMGLSMIEMMHFETIIEAQTYMEQAKKLYPDINIYYKIYADYRQ